MPQRIALPLPLSLFLSLSRFLSFSFSLVLFHIITGTRKSSSRSTLRNHREDFVFLDRWLVHSIPRACRSFKGTARNAAKSFARVYPYFAPSCYNRSLFSLSLSQIFFFRLEIFLILYFIFYLFFIMYSMFLMYYFFMFSAIIVAFYLFLEGSPYNNKRFISFPPSQLICLFRNTRSSISEKKCEIDGDWTWQSRATTSNAMRQCRDAWGDSEM